MVIFNCKRLWLLNMRFKQNKQRTIKPRIMVFCEGDTEKTYFHYLKNKYRINLEIEKKDAQEKLLSVSKKHIEYHNIYLEEKDSVWCVMDVEENKKKWLEILPKIIQFEKEKNHFVVFSNPCFEIWLLLYFKYITKKITSKELEEELSKIFKEKYRKGKNLKKYLNCLEFTEKIAIENSKNLIKYHKQKQMIGSNDLITNYNDLIKDYNNNPITTVHLLVEKIIDVR